MSNKRIFTLVIVLALAVGCVFALSSCMYVAEIVTDTDTSENTNTPSGGSGSNTPAGPTSGSGSGQDTTDTQNGLVFHPDASTDGTNASPDAKAILSTVAIDTRFDILGSYPYYDQVTEYTSFSSGVIYKLDKEKGDAYIITNYHAVYNKGEVAVGGFSDSITLYLYGMQQDQYGIPAKVIGGSLTHDLAVLRVEGSEVLKNSMACEADLGNSEAVRVLDEVMVIGNPEGFGFSITEGTISVESENLSMTGADGRTGITLRVMRTSAAINDGNSGGGLYSVNGELVGIVCAKRTGSEVDNFGYAIPVNLAVKLAENIIRNCDGENNFSLKKCIIGIGVDVASSGLVTDSEGNLIIIEQAAISSVETYCITDKLKVGDIITAMTIDGKRTEITRAYMVSESLIDAIAGSSVIISVNRNGETFDISLTLPDSCVTVIR